ncbi:PKD domain-containing protein [Bacteroides congonensis]
MEKFKNPKVIIVLCAIALCIGGAVLFKLLSNKEIVAYVSPTDLYLGEEINFADSTKNASQWLWEFGDGSESTLRSGTYTPRYVGSMSVRLTVDSKTSRRFLVNVRERPQKGNMAIITIDAPETAVQGEFITVKGNGEAKEWRWEFGETGRVDSREQEAMYVYESPGEYEILLSTETTEYPIRHLIKILPSSITDTTDVALSIGNDIRERLQAIVDGKSFNENYNYILSQYLHYDPNIPVLVNNKKGGNSFWSYCQGLKIIGKGITTINDVVVDIQEDSGLISKLIVMQEINN